MNGIVRFPCDQHRAMYIYTEIYISVYVNCTSLSNPISLFPSNKGIKFFSPDEAKKTLGKPNHFAVNGV